MRTLYDVQEWLKNYGYINLLANRLDAIYFMTEELRNLVAKGILKSNDQDYLTARLILRQEERLEEEQK